ncbi:SCO2521 family protein [Catenulispora yoronensis]
MTALVQLSPGSPVSRVERPVHRAVSADLLTGVDCGLHVLRHGRGRAIGTVLSHAIVTGGRVLQGSAYVTLLPAASRERQAWRHYLRRPGVAEIIGSPDPDNVLDGFLDDQPPARGLDLASISDRIVEDVQQSSVLDHGTALRASATTTRWAASLRPDSTLAVGIVKSHMTNAHVIRLRGHPDDLPTLLRFCEEFALHEWLLATVRDVVVVRAEHAVAQDRDPLDSLLFALNQLMPLWMPPRYLNARIKELWDGLERRTHYELVFLRATERVRDLRDQMRIRPPRRI